MSYPARPNDSKTLALAFLQSFWDGEPERGYSLCAPDAHWQFQRSLHTPDVVPVRAAVEWLNTHLVTGFDPNSGYKVQLGSVIGEGDEASAEYSATGLTRSGETYYNRYHVRFTTRAGKIVSIRPYFDTHYVHKALFKLD